MKQLRCDECGRFIPLKDLESGQATRRLLTPDTPFSSETYETLCKDHSIQYDEAGNTWSG